uniref:protein xylosyltransferase n=1 Tax=Saccoglossus kowalevskii TaxID=10224 RepID=A0ABM0MHR7_SACKO|nr:PREDICTED: uncharacterized protein LOC102808919 [Saccoglossus kowalevskii]
MWKVCYLVVFLLVVTVVLAIQPLFAMRLPVKARENGDERAQQFREHAMFADLPKVKYDQRMNADLLEESYKWQENKRAAILCPSGSFIGEIGFAFSGIKKYFGNSMQHFKLNDLPVIATSNEREIVLKRRSTDKQSKGFWNLNSDPGDYLSTCDPVLFCLGHQACLFKITIDTCANDPMPGQRKLLELRVSCVKDEMFAKYMRFNTGNANTDFDITESVRKRRDQVLYIYVNDDNTDDQAVSLVQVYIPEEDIFGLTCPEDAYKAGYGGVCMNPPPPQLDIANTLWNVIGRVPSSGCRKEILESYCSYHYNLDGGCVPPVLLQHPQDGQSLSMTDKLKFSFKSLPEPGHRPDLTEHLKLISSPYASLIPARLGFALIVHEYPDTVIQLLQALYRPHFFFCVHVDQRAEEIRQDLIERTQSYKNIHILPRHRSFVASWGSYEIVRAELECFEELLRMGAWDFVINLSGADLPIRNVDDVAALLAPARGHTFLRKNGRWRDRVPKVTDFTDWYSCDAHVYNASYRGERPQWADMHSASQWGVYAREFVSFIVSEDRGPNNNKLQYFAQTCIIPDESYMMSNLMISHLRDTYLPGHLHFLKNFDSRDEFGFCRHTDDIDFCGQGPGIFEIADMVKIQASSTHAMFARKFDYDVTNEVRQQTLQWAKYGFYDNLQAVLGKDILIDLVEVTLAHRYGSLWKQKVKFEGIKKWRLFPQFYHSNACCRPLFSTRNAVVHEVRYWLDLKVIEFDGSINGTAKLLRSSVIPKAHSECFSDGHLRALQLSTVVKAAGKGGWTVGSVMEKVAQTFVPYDVSSTDTIYVNALFRIPRNEDEDGRNLACSDENTLKRYGVNPRNKNYNYARFPLIGTETLDFNATLIEPSGKARCMRTMKFTHSRAAPEKETLGKKTKAPPDTTTFTNSFSHCGYIEEGLWTLSFTQQGVSDPFQYRASVYIVRATDVKTVKNTPLSLWHVEEITRLPESGEFYDVDTSLEPFEDFYGNDVAVANMPGDDNYGNEGGVHILKRNYLHKMPNEDIANNPDTWVRRAMEF